MPNQLTNTIIEHLASLINVRLAVAATKTKASLLLMADGNRDEAFDILLEIKPFMHEARALLNAIATLRRSGDGD